MPRYIVADVEQPAVQTIRVRIAVAVDTVGKWCASGWGGGECDGDVEGVAMDGLDSAKHQQIVWVEATVPVPVEQTVEGEVQR